MNVLKALKTVVGKTGLLGVGAAVVGLVLWRRHRHKGGAASA
jgi:hypothetical protein